MNAAKPKIRILLADDHLVVRMGLTTILSIEKDLVLVGEAGDGLEAIDLVRKSHPDVVIMDVMMPKINGYEATKAIRGLQNRPDAITIPIIAMTANAFAEDVQASLDAGMNGHLSKPIVMDEVIKTIARNLDR